MHKKLKIGFIGGGINSAIGLTHKISSQLDGKFELVAGCFSRNKKINQKTGFLWGIKKERIYANWEDLLVKEKNNLDAFVVLVPTHSHYEIVKSLIKENCKVICEKALTSTSKEALQIKNIMDSKSFLLVTYNYTGYPMIRELKNMIKKGMFGTISQIMIEMPQETFLKIGEKNKVPIPQKWRLKDGPIPTISLDLGIHLHNLISFLTEEKPLKVIGTQNSFGAFDQIIDNINCIAVYSNNLICNLWYSKVALGHRNGLRIRIYGEEGAAEWYQNNPEILIYTNRKGEINILDRGINKLEVSLEERYNRFKAGHPHGFIEAFANHYIDIAYNLEKYYKNNIFKKTKYVFDINDALEGLIMLEKIAESSTNNKWENL